MNRRVSDGENIFGGTALADQDLTTSIGLLLIGRLVGFLPNNAHLAQCGFSVFTTNWTSISCGL